MMWADALAFFHPPFFFAGLMGGLQHAFWVKKATPREIIGYIVTGALAANFVAPYALDVIALVPRLLSLAPPELIAFGIGMSGKHICFAFETFFNHFDLLGKTKNE